MNNNKQKFYESLWFLAVFVFFYVWFSRIHPLVIYDADDWTYIAYVRKATPIWGDWNPAKVFPEVIMPFLSTIALHLLMPLTHDYIQTFTIAHAFVVSGFLTVYAWCLSGLMKRMFSLSRLSGNLICALFLVLHFLVFRSQESENTYMFFCEDLNCYYNYLLPALLNATLVMYMMHNEAFDVFLQSAGYAKKGIFIAVVYLAIFSNLVTSGILAAYAGSRLLLNLLRNLKRFRLKDYVKENGIYLLILVFWFISAVFELSGGRAASSASRSLLHRMMNTAHLLLDVLHGCNRMFWLCVFAICAIAVFLFLRAKGKGDEETVFFRNFLACIIAGAALLLYIMILCAMVWYGYIRRSEYLFGLFFYGFLVVMMALGYAVKKQPQILTILPLVLLVLTFEINTNGKTFRESNMSGYDPDTCAAISRDILDQFLAADEAGMTEMTLYVPMHVADPVNDDNWPHSLVLIPRISQALYEHGMISRVMDLNVVADPAFNERHHLPVPSK